MQFPDYQGGSIVNLMSSLGAHLQYTLPYPQSTLLPKKFLQPEDGVVLLVIDGLGYRYLTSQGKNSTLGKKIHGKMTSVFPSTTAAAMTTFYSGLAPLNHGIPSWFTYLREFGVVATILPMHIRPFRSPLLFGKLKTSDIFQFPAFTDRISVPSTSLFPKPISKTPYSSYAVKGSKEKAYPIDKPDQFTASLVSILRKNPRNHFLLGYWSGFDTSAHISGIQSEATFSHFQQLDHSLGEFLETVENEFPDTKAIITADHGLIDTTPEHTLWLENYPELSSMLTLPLSGEMRAPFFYIRPHRQSEFLQVMNRDFGDIGELWSLSDLLQEKIFGMYEPHPRFTERVGDYVLLMKKNYIMRDRLLGEEKEALIGNHGGVSPDEMEVPLILG